MQALQEAVDLNRDRNAEMRDTWRSLDRLPLENDPKADRQHAEEEYRIVQKLANGT